MKEEYNVLQTPVGGFYHLELSDGTRVWLNACSELRYPVSFVGKERRVELKGEAYFQVSRDSLRPFYVQTSRQNIRVLGIHLMCVLILQIKSIQRWSRGVLAFIVWGKIVF